MFNFKRLFEGKKSQEPIENVFRYSTFIRDMNGYLQYGVRIKNDFLNFEVVDVLVSSYKRSFFSNEKIKKFAKMTNEEFERGVKDIVLKEFEAEKIKGEMEKEKQIIMNKLTRTGEFTLQLEVEINE